LAKLIKILAASVGGGLVLGAGIRLGEAIATWEPESQPHNRKLSERLAELENRLENLAGNGRGTGLSAESQAATSAIRDQAGAEQHFPDRSGAEAFSETSLRLRGELQGWLEESVAAHMAQVELRLQAESERDRKQMLDAFVENLQTRVIKRISHLEEEVAGQSAAMSELRECSLRTERSIQKLLGGLDRLVVKEPTAKEPSGEEPLADRAPARSKESDPARAARPGGAPAFASQRGRSSRWKIFG
jgi:uncharacterized coiled-coil protein SlyX